jgi:TPR repeat protein
MKRTLASLVIGLSLALAGTTNAWAQDFDKGLNAYRNADYATALEEWRPLAEKGNAKAQDGLGLMYATGKGVPKNSIAAADWWMRAAQQNYAKSQYNLGVLY